MLNEAFTTHWIHKFTLPKISFFLMRSDPDKIAYERQANESVDEKSLSKVVSKRSTPKRIWAEKG